MRLPRIITSIAARARQNARLEPSRDWMVMLILASIVLIALCVWNAWAFDTISRGGVIGTSTKQPAPVFSPASLDAIQAIFTTRSTEEQKSITGVYRYTDPSQ